MTYEQKLKLEREAFLRERKYLSDWSEAIKENYRRIREKHDFERMMKEIEGEL